MNRFITTTKPIFLDSFKTAKWILKIIIPTSLLVTLLNYYGIIELISSYLYPFFVHLGLYGKSSIVFISSLFLPLYAPIAMMSSLGLNLREVSILALMCLISHNIIVEGSVQRRIGTPLWLSITIRVTSSIIGGYLLNLILPTSLSEEIPSIAAKSVDTSALLPTLKEWAYSTLSLSLKIFIIITLLMLLQEYLKRKGLIERISNFLAPLMKAFGLHSNSAFLWLIAQTVGLAYGAGIMKKAVEENNFDPKEINRVNQHIAINHSLLEDTTLFVIIGVSWYYIVIPRLIFAIIIVWGIRFINAIYRHHLITSKQ